MEKIRKALPEIFSAFYYSTKLPLTFYDIKGSFIFSFPDEIEKNPVFPENLSLILANHDFSNEDYLQLNNKEIYIYIIFKYNKDKTGIIFAGPMLNKAITEKEIDRISFQNNLSLKEKDLLRNFYKKLPSFSEPQYFYLKKLLKLSLQNIIEHEVSISDFQHSTNNLDKTYKNFYEEYFIDRLEYTQYTQHKLSDEDILWENLLNSSTTEEIKLIFSLFKERFPYSYSSNIGNGNILRSKKNRAIIVNSILCRLAIRKGLNSKVAFHLANLYANEFERANKIEKVESIQIESIKKYHEVLKEMEKNKHSYLINKIIRYINNNITLPLTIKSIAEEFNYNPSYISTLITQDLGMTFTEYFNKKRIEKAKEMLLYSNYSIVEISNYLNFSSQAYFTSVFKKFTRLTPTEFRKIKGI